MTAASVGNRSHVDDEAAALLARMTLRDVRLVRWSGETFSYEPADQVRLPAAQTSYLREEERLAFRFDQDIELFDATEERTTSISATVVLDFHLLDDTVLTDDDDRIIAGGLMPVILETAYPFIREAVHTMSTRLGIEPIALGMLDSEYLLPRDVHVQGVAEFREISRPDP